MSHRTALALSIALTLVLATGIFAGRDRLFEAAAGAGPATVSPPRAVSLDDAASESQLPVAGVAPQVIEIPLPSIDQRSTLAQEDDQRSRGRDDDRNWGDDDDEHEEEVEDKYEEEDND